MKIQHEDGTQELNEELTAAEVLEKTKEALQDSTVVGIKTYRMHLAHGLGRRKKRLMSGFAKLLKATKRAATRSAPNKAQEIARRQRQIERGMLKIN